MKIVRAKKRPNRYLNTANGKPREYLITRGVLNSVGRVVLKTYRFTASSGAEAGRKADEQKYNDEVALGFHQKHAKTPVLA